MSAFSGSDAIANFVRIVRRAGALVCLSAIPALADAASACHGYDLLARMAAQAPADYAAVDRDARAMPFGEGRLFRISRVGIPPSYLLGTVHVADPRVAVLSTNARDAIGKAAIVAVEANEGDKPIVIARTRRAIAAPDTMRASQLLDPAAYSRLQALLLQRGFPLELARQLKAAALALMLDLPTCALAHAGARPFLDEQVVETARAANVRVVGLETIAEQVGIADDLAAAEQTVLLRAVLAQASSTEDTVETTILAYLHGHIGLLLAWTRSPNPIPGVSGAGTPPAVLDRIVTARTRRMRDRLLPLLAKGGVFVAIGAAHIPGNEGLASLLETAGYRVEKVE